MAVLDSAASTGFDAALKTYYLEPLREMVNKSTVLLDELETRKETVSGRNYIVPLIARRHPGVTSRSGTSKPKLPTAQHQEYAVATYGMKYHYGVIEIDGPTMRRSSGGDRGSFIAAVDAETKGLGEALSMDINRQLFGDGTNILASIATTISTVATSGTLGETRFLDKDRICSVLKNDDGAILVTSLTITNISSDTVVSFAATGLTCTTSTYGIYGETESTSITPYRQALTGLKALAFNANITNMSTAYVGGVTRASNDWWQANVDANSGTARSVTISLLESAILKPINNRYGGVIPTMGVMPTNIWATIGILLHADKRYSGEVTTLEGGWKALGFSGVNLVYDKDAEAGVINFFNKENLFFLSDGDLQWLEEDGRLWKWVSGYDSYIAGMVWDLELATDKPGNLVRLADLESSLS